MAAFDGSTVDPVHLFADSDSLSFAGLEETTDGAFYMCPLCGSVFTSIDGLTSHQAVHELETVLVSSETEENVDYGNPSNQLSTGNEEIGYEPVTETDISKPKPQAISAFQMDARRLERLHKPSKRSGSPWIKEEQSDDVDDSDDDVMLVDSTSFPVRQSSSTTTKAKRVKRDLLLQSRFAGDACPYCPYIITNPWELISHMVDEHDAELMSADSGRNIRLDRNDQCPYCDDLFNTLHDLLVHVLVSHAQHIFNKHGLVDSCKIHMQTSTGRSLSLTIRTKGKLPATYTTKIISKGLSVRPRNVHQRTSTSVPRVAPHIYVDPDECGHMTDEQIAQAEQLIRMHTRGFQCTQCFKVKDSREVALEHVFNCHLIVRKYKCPHCPKSYDKQSNYVNHVNGAHSSERKFPCPNCPMKYRTKGDLMKHLKKGVCEQARSVCYPCPKCGLLWYHQSALITHQRQCDGGAASEAAHAVAGIGGM